MIFNRKSILIGILCCIIGLGIGVANVAAEEIDFSQVTEVDQENINFVGNTKARDWNESSQSNAWVFMRDFESIAVDEMPVCILKTNVSGGPVPNGTKIVNGENAVSIDSFLQSLANGDISTVKKITYWTHKDSGMKIADTIIIR